MQKVNIEVPETPPRAVLDVAVVPSIEELDSRRRNLQAAIEALKARVKKREETEWSGGA